MKKIVAILMLLIMAVSVTGCKSGKNEPLDQEVKKLEAKADEAEKQEKEEKEEKADKETKETTEDAEEKAE